MTNLQLTNGNTSLEPTAKALQQLSPQSQETVVALVRQLTEREGITNRHAYGYRRAIPWYH